MFVTPVDTYAVWEFSIFISMELRGILIRPFVNSSQSVELPMLFRMQIKTNKCIKGVCYNYFRVIRFS